MSFVIFLLFPHETNGIGAPLANILSQIDSWKNHYADTLDQNNVLPVRKKTRKMLEGLML